jgi:hypothetical protein
MIPSPPRDSAVKSAGALDDRPGKAQSALEPHQLEQEKIIQALPHKAADFPFDGRTYRIVRFADMKGMEIGSRYWVVPLVEAKTLISQMAMNSRNTPAHRAAFQGVSEHLQDPRLATATGTLGLLLLRQLPMRSATASSGPTVTPSQLRKASEKHWIEIQLVDESGDPVANQSFLIITADGTEQKGTTDDTGSARLDGIVQGQCKISFPDLDQDVWS